MLARLTIQNYALIDSLDISFPEGLIILSGETGAGKSIIIGALSLILGAKADVSILKDASKNSVVEAEFFLSQESLVRLSDLFTDNPELLESVDDNRLILRRVISSSGRSRSFINDEPVATSLLTSISSILIDIHSQHQTLILNDPQFQLSVLDNFASNGDLLKEFKEIYLRNKELKHRLSLLNRDLLKLTNEESYNNFVFNQLSEANLFEGELEELEQEHITLANASEIKQVISSSLLDLNPLDTSITQILKNISVNVSKIVSYVPALESIISEIDSCRIELEDVEFELRKADDKVQVSPERLERIEERLSELYSLLKRHNCSSVSELIEMRDSLAEGATNMENLEEEIQSVKSEIDRSGRDMERLSIELHDKRSEAIDSLSKEIETMIRSLEMPYAEFRIELIGMDEYNEFGRDRVIFLFSANGSEKLVELSKVASGGELSRIMLVLKSLIAKFVTLPTMVFDEIDSGVSGRIADKMGDLISELSENVQVFAITHLPQIASKRGKHFLVYKEFNPEGVMTSYIEEIEGEERLNEVARMLSGSKMTEAALENARVLINENNNQ